MAKTGLEFKISVSLLASCSFRLLSRDILKKYLPKTRIAQLESDTKSATKLLLKLGHSKRPDKKNVFKSWSKKFEIWQQYLVRLVVLNQQAEWYYISLSLHSILDSYYHIFKKLEGTSRSLCKWCGNKLDMSWRNLLSTITLDAVPSSYICTSLGSGEPIDCAFSEVKIVYTGLLYD